MKRKNTYETEEEAEEAAKPKPPPTPWEKTMEKKGGVIFPHLPTTQGFTISRKAGSHSPKQNTSIDPSSPRENKIELISSSGDKERLKKSPGKNADMIGERYQPKSPKRTDVPNLKDYAAFTTSMNHIRLFSPIKSSDTSMKIIAAPSQEPRNLVINRRPSSPNCSDDHSGNQHIVKFARKKDQFFPFSQNQTPETTKFVEEFSTIRKMSPKFKAIELKLKFNKRNKTKLEILDKNEQDKKLDEYAKGQKTIKDKLQVNKLLQKTKSPKELDPDILQALEAKQQSEAKFEKEHKFYDSGSCFKEEWGVKPPTRISFTMVERPRERRLGLSQRAAARPLCSAA
jgi:hypothetical protein